MEGVKRLSVESNAIPFMILQIKSYAIPSKDVERDRFSVETIASWQILNSYYGNVLPVAAMTMFFICWDVSRSVYVCPF